jgi:hypothetical protein
MFSSACIIVVLFLTGADTSCADKSVPWSVICEDMNQANEFASSLGLMLNNTNVVCAAAAATQTAKGPEGDE